MSFELRSDELARFERDGFIGPFDVYARNEMLEELKRLRVALLDRSRAVYELDMAGNIANYDRHLDVAFLTNHVRRPQIVDRVVSILGPDVLCWRSEFFTKYPGDEGTDWHQSRNLAIGSGIAPLRATKPHARYADVFLTLSVWTALTDATVELGCMQYVPGSHRAMHYDDQRRMTWRPERINRIFKSGIKRGLYGYDTSEIQVAPNFDPSECNLVTVEATAGQCILSWEATMHGSLPNTTTDRTRMAFVARYVTPDVQIYQNQTTLHEYGGTADLSRWSAVLVSGLDRYGHNRVIAPSVRGR